MGSKHLEGTGALSEGFGQPFHNAVGELVARGHTGHAALALDADGYIRNWNFRAPLLLGYSASKFLGQHVSMLYPAGHAGEASRQLELALSRGTLTHEGWRVRGNGSLFWARAAITPVHENGRHLGFTKMLTGLRSTARLQSVLETVGEGVITLDESGIVYSLNRAGEEMLGYRESELVGQSIALVMGDERIAQMRADGTEDYLRTRIVELLGRGQRTTTRDRSGREFPIEVRASHLQLGGKSYYTLAFADITEHLQMEAELRQSQKMEEVGLLAGGVAHDFNNLLTVIQGYCDVMLLEMGEDGRHRPEVEAILGAATRASALTRQLLSFSRKSAMQICVSDLNEVVTDSEEILRRIIGGNIQVHSDLAADLLPVEVDTGQMGQVLINLAVNARDAMPGGGSIRFHTENVQFAAGDDQELPPGRYVCLRVHDTGLGMTPNVLAHLFEPFFTTKNEGQGTGLGLSVVHGIVRQCGGVIRVSSTEGVGSVFSVFLPAATGEEEEHVLQTQPKDERTQSAATILLAEDEESVRTVAKLILERQGYAVIAAPDGDEALALFDEHGDNVAMLVTDIMMPRMGGRELAEAVLERRPELPVLFISGYPDDAAIGDGFSDAPVFFLSKPFTPRELTAQIREAMGDS